MKHSRKKYLITGCSRGIGKSIALKLLKHNYDIIGISKVTALKATIIYHFFMIYRILKAYLPY